MPKDPRRNVDRYKTRGGHFNEFDFIRHHSELAKEHDEPHEQGSQMPFTSEQKKVKRIKELLAQYGESGPQTTDREDDQVKQEAPRQEDDRSVESLEDHRKDESGTEQTTDQRPDNGQPEPAKRKRTVNKKTTQMKAKTLRKGAEGPNQPKTKPASRQAAKSSSRSTAKPAKTAAKASKKPATAKKSATMTQRKASASRRSARNK